LTPYCAAVPSINCIKPLAPDGETACGSPLDSACTTAASKLLEIPAAEAACAISAFNEVELADGVAEIGAKETGVGASPTAVVVDLIGVKVTAGIGVLLTTGEGALPQICCVDTEAAADGRIGSDTLLGGGIGVNAVGSPVLVGAVEIVVSLAEVTGTVVAVAVLRYEAGTTVGDTGVT